MLRSLLVLIVNTALLYFVSAVVVGILAYVFRPWWRIVRWWAR